MAKFEAPERMVCCTLCMCMAVAVFSSVALVYLTALVYMPAKREINSGLSDVPVVCTTVQRMETDDCDWYSCGEWCLSKSSHCVKLWAQVRRNGTDLELRGCQNIHDITCMVLDDDFVEKKSCSTDSDCASHNQRFFSKCPNYDCGTLKQPFRCDSKVHRCVSVRQYRNCKNDDVCTDLHHLFHCQDGLCQNITSVFECTIEDLGPPLDCRDKRNCITLKGYFMCEHGVCRQLIWPWHCERRCPSLTTNDKQNVILLSGDRMLSANCDIAIKAATSITSDKETIWRDVQNDRNAILMASCTSVKLRQEVESGSSVIEAGDCVNGTLMPRQILPGPKANYTSIHDIFGNLGHKFKLDQHGKGHQLIPFDSDIIIYNKTKLLINTEACINTLQEECTEFYLDHRRDGRNYSARDRFPCFYTPNHERFVTTRFSINQTRYIFLISFAVPASLWVLSCSCLFGCSKMLRVEENGEMRVRCRKELFVEDSEVPARKPSVKRRSIKVKKPSV
ncbi:hypothetical protein TCAL_04884 [Tigriopus californicus]|uniref:Uncharacterized protein n=1 Tax=Tigriopus californicus TaxID=6832 RepID=A0A553NX03_TIGCA|nr:uncharacterized protein LOC131886971 [Tigriopus californicus]TRY69959.1 hypothetical protein TCAL_04884 [Tigriopus californicus]